MKIKKKGARCLFQVFLHANVLPHPILPVGGVVEAPDLPVTQFLVKFDRASVELKHAQLDAPESLRPDLTFDKVHCQVTNPLAAG